MLQFSAGPDTLLTVSCLTLKGESKDFLFFILCPNNFLFSNKQAFDRANQICCWSNKRAKQTHIFELILFSAQSPYCSLCLTVEAGVKMQGCNTVCHHRTSTQFHKRRPVHPPRGVVAWTRLSAPGA